MVLIQIEAAIARSATYTVIHIFCIICLIFLLYKTLKRFAEKRTQKNAPLGIGAPISIMLQYEIVILAGLVLTNVSSDLLFYIRVNIVANPGFSDPVAQVACEYLNIIFQLILALFIWYIAWFSNKLLLFKGKRFRMINMLLLLFFISAFVIGLVTGLAWSGGVVPLGGKREPALWLMSLNGIYLVIIVVPSIIASLRAARKATGKVNKYGMWFIMLFFTLVLLLISFQALFALTSEYVYSYTSWILFPAGIFFAYLGLIMPPFLRTRLGEPPGQKKG
nr:hypothetical protein [Candidatus Sigynarchaeum springense]MDO8116513.1 hypothetical protein [Candidatus Sigynarchaeota archaeon]